MKKDFNLIEVQSGLVNNKHQTVLDHKAQIKEIGMSFIYIYIT